ncbi:type ISP restriction/modification enzyme [Candidatus Skiveiella danica]
MLHDPVYREKYAQNLKREFPRIPSTARRRLTSGTGPLGASPDGAAHRL